MTSSRTLSLAPMVEGSPALYVTANIHRLSLGYSMRLPKECLGVVF